MREKPESQNPEHECIPNPFPKPESLETLQSSTLHPTAHTANTEKSAKPKDQGGQPNGGDQQEGRRPKPEGSVPPGKSDGLDLRFTVQDFQVEV